MPYQAEISRSNPGCFLFIIDQSGSMSDRAYGQQDKSKAEALADAINRLLADLCIRCTRNPHEGVRHYYDVGVIGYGRGNGEVGPAFGGALAGRIFVPIPEIASNPLRIEQRKITREDGAGGLIERTVRFPIWFEPRADDGTPMCDALRLAYEHLAQWVSQHPKSFPPIVIHITDGQPTDGDPVPFAQQIQQLSTADGNVLLFNLHISETPGQPVLYPDNANWLPDDYARTLFQMSSILPPYMVEAARAERLPVTSNSRGFVFQADMTEVIRFLNIGTRPRSNLR